MNNFKKGDKVTNPAYEKQGVVFTYVEYLHDEPEYRRHSVLWPNGDADTFGTSASLRLVETHKQDEQSEDMVNHPNHYTSDPSGIECITVTRHRNFNVGNAIKYLWRAGLKKDSVLQDSAKQIEDLEKSVFYIKDEIERLKELQKCP